MKSKSFLFVIAFCAGLQVNMGFASQNQSWIDWFRAKFTTAQKAAAEKYYNVRDIATVGFSGAATAATVAAAKAFEPSLRSGLSSITPSWITPSWAGQILLLSMGTGLVFATFVSICNQLTMKSKVDAIKTLKVVLAEVLGNALLYPTRKSKIYALEKDRFSDFHVLSDYIRNDRDDVIEEACAELSKEIDSASYPEGQKISDEVIDDKMAEFRNRIEVILNPPGATIAPGKKITAREKIAALDRILRDQKSFDVPTMQAYLSVYFRLKNRQIMEERPTPFYYLTREQYIIQQ